MSDISVSDVRVGFAMCGSYCTFAQAMETLERVCGMYKDVTPIMSENAYITDTRFGKASDFVERIEKLCGKSVISTIKQAEPIGPKGLLDILVIAPCTGNTLAKMANGVTDSSVTMAAKAHLRNGRPVLVAVSTNDALCGNAENIGKLLGRKNYYFVPFCQDDPQGKPCSLVADFTKLPEAIECALSGHQMQPLLLQKE